MARSEPNPTSHQLIRRHRHRHRHCEPTAIPELLLTLSPWSSAAMFILSLRRAAIGALTQSVKKPILPTPAASRFHGTSAPDGPQHERVALQMIQYALGHARSHRSGESYEQAMLVLEQGLSNLRRGDGSGDDAVGMLMLAMSTLHYERGELHDAMEKLQMARQLGHTSLDLRVAAWEGLVGLNLEMGQDVSSLMLETIASRDDAFQLLTNRVQGTVPVAEIYDSWVKSVKGLADLVGGELKPVEILLSGPQKYNKEEDKVQMGKVALYHGEFFHCSRSFSFAEDFYKKALQLSDTIHTPDISYLAAANMVPEEISLAASCALGQLFSHSGNFHEAEEVLTMALTKAENHFGSTHPKVGVLLTCIALMFKHKAKMEASSSILIQEGLYRRAIDLLKAPPLVSEVAELQVAKRDIIALARGGYADILCIQQNRKGEGERMRKWAEAAWRNRRLSLAEALESSEPSKAVVIDTRIFRVL